jgi:hypothetical protein
MSTSLVTYDPKQLNALVPPVVAVPDNSLALSSEMSVTLSGPIADPMEEIRIRAETVSSLLREIIEQRPPLHWGINE